MKHTKEEIIGALKIIKEECNEVLCQQCPLGGNEMINGSFCRLKSSNPGDWQIKEELPKEVWRAFK